MLEALHKLDVEWMLRLNREWVNPFLDHLLPTVTNFAVWLPILLVAAAVWFWRGKFQTRAFLVCMVLSVLCNEGLVSGPLKKIVLRQRPNDVLPEVVKRNLPKARPQMLAMFQAPDLMPGHPIPPSSHDHSFPSSHTSNLFAAAATACRFLRRHGLWFVALAALVGWSRIYCGVHWPSDVAISALLGWCTGWLACEVMNRLWRRKGARWFQAMHQRHPELIPTRSSTLAA